MSSFSFPELSLILFWNSQIFISNSSYWRDNVVANGATWNREMTIVLILYHQTKTIGVVSIRRNTDTMLHHYHLCSQVGSMWFLVSVFFLFLITSWTFSRTPKIHLLLLLPQEQLKGFNMISGSRVTFSVKPFQLSLSILCLLAWGYYVLLHITPTFCKHDIVISKYLHACLSSFLRRTGQYVSFFKKFMYVWLGLPCYAGAFSGCRAQASHHSGFPCYGAQALEHVGSVAVAHRF